MGRPRRYRLFVGALVGALWFVLLPTAAHATFVNQPGAAVSRFSGVNRYDTAATIAMGTFAAADVAVIASGTSFADALSGDYLAGSVGGPILLTDPTTLSPETANALAALKVRGVLLLGGTSAVSSAVAAAISAMTSTNDAHGNIVVTRIAGATRYDTDKAVAETPAASYVGSINGQRTAMLASGATFPDALAGGPLAFSSALPIVLTDPTSLSLQASQVLSDLHVQHVLILGGTHAVAASIEDELTTAGLSVQRLSGPSRTGTALEIATFAGLNLGYGTTAQPATTPPEASFTHVNVARGDDSGGGADALALGPHAGHERAPIFLTRSADDPSEDTIFGIEPAFGPSTVTAIDIAGGATAVSPALEQLLVVAAAGGPIGQMAVSPTAGTVGTVITMMSVDPCPPIPAGSDAEVWVQFVDVSDPTNIWHSITEGPMAQSGGPWTFHDQVPSYVPAGTYQATASCALGFPNGDFYEYATYVGPKFTVN